MACGRPVVHSVLKKFFSTCPLEELQSEDEAAETISKLLTDRGQLEKRAEDQLAYVNSAHSAPTVSKKLADIYFDLQKNH